LFQQRAVEKAYEAIAPPLPALAMPHVRRSQLRAGEPFFRMREGDGPVNSETRIEVMQRGLHAWRYGLHPVTGRKHQLRVHMAALGLPLLGDRIYPTLLPEGTDDPANPLRLLAHRVAFDDPVTGEPREFVSRQALAFPSQLLSNR
jgi:tRNA pseudouridine32 synthase/23S rRNA pseudouridine746 synthase